MSLKSRDKDEWSEFNLGRQGQVNIVKASCLYTLLVTQHRLTSRLPVRALLN